MGSAASKRVGCSLHIIKVSKDLPAHKFRLLPIFHYIIGINGDPVVEEGDIKKIAESWEKGRVDLLVYDSRSRTTKEVVLERASNEKIGFSLKVHHLPMVPNTFRVLQVEYNSPALDARLQNEQDYIIGYEGGSFSSLTEFEAVMYKNRETPVVLLVYNIGTATIREVPIVPTAKGSVGCDLGTGLLNDIPYSQEPIEIVGVVEPSEPLEQSAANPIEHELYTSLNQPEPEEVEEVVPQSYELQDEQLQDEPDHLNRIANTQIDLTADSPVISPVNPSILLTDTESLEATQSTPHSATQDILHSTTQSTPHSATQDILYSTTQSTPHSATQHIIQPVSNTFPQPTFQDIPHDVAHSILTTPPSTPSTQLSACSNAFPQTIPNTSTDDIVLDNTEYYQQPIPSALGDNDYTVMPTSLLIDAPEIDLSHSAATPNTSHVRSFKYDGRSNEPFYLDRNEHKVEDASDLFRDNYVPFILHPGSEDKEEHGSFTTDYE